MSLKATKLALGLIKSMSEHGSVNHGVAVRAEKEIEALEKAAKVFAGYMESKYPTREALNSATRLMEHIAREAK